MVVVVTPMSSLIMTMMMWMTVAVGTMVTAAPAPGPENIDLFMPNVQPQVPDTYLCQATKVNDSHRYITGFIPKADSHIAHHILLYGCTEPGAHEGQVWNCGEMLSTDSKYQRGSVCNSGSHILYAWAMEAPRLTLPPDVGFDVGQDTDIKYLVLQVHYKNVSKFLPPENGQDSSGLTLETTNVPTKKQAGVYLMLTGGEIPPHSIEHFEAACTFDVDVDIVPFAFRTHAHSLGRVISGYRVRDGEWTEIGRQDPRLPEMFYNVTNPGITVKKGDILASRCSMENGKDRTVEIGATQNDEMCNFYVMYYVDRSPEVVPQNCFKPGPPYWYWKNFSDKEALNIDGAPDTASVIPGSNGPLIRNATTDISSNNMIGDINGNDKNIVDGIPGSFDDSISDQFMEEAVRDMDPDELLYLVQQLAQEEEEEEKRYREWQQRQYLRQQLARNQGIPRQPPSYYQSRF